MHVVSHLERDEKYYKVDSRDNIRASLEVVCSQVSRRRCRVTSEMLASGLRDCTSSGVVIDKNSES